jgi:hypothetical protein
VVPLPSFIFDFIPNSSMRPRIHLSLFTSFCMAPRNCGFAAISFAAAAAARNHRPMLVDPCWSKATASSDLFLTISRRRRQQQDRIINATATLILEQLHHYPSNSCSWSGVSLSHQRYKPHASYFGPRTVVAKYHQYHHYHR